MDDRDYEAMNPHEFGNDFIADVMTDKQKIELLKSCFNDTIWMAIRYAHSEKDCFLVENAIKAYKVLFPDFKMEQDFVVMKDDKHLLSKSIIWDI